MLYRNRFAGSRLLVCGCLLLCSLLTAACALTLQRGAEAADRSPLYVGSSGKEGYFFSLRVIRAWEEHGGKATQDSAEAKTQLSFTGPVCDKRTLLKDRSGDNTDFFVLCQVKYQVKHDAQLTTGGSERSGTLSERFILSSEENLSAYYRKENELEEDVLDGLAQKLVLALKVIE